MNLLNISKNNKIISFSLSFLIGFFIISLFSAGYFSSFQPKMADKLFLPGEPNQNIIIIAIDNQSISQIGRWPWDRKIHAELLDILIEYKPKVIGLDVAFLEKTADDANLAKSLEKLGNVVLPMEIDIEGVKDNYLIVKNLRFPVDELKRVATVGFTNIPPDKDGVLRKTPVAIKDDRGIQFNAFFIEILKKYYGQAEPRSKLGSTTGDNFLSNLPLEKYQNLIVNYVGGPGTFKTVPYIKVLNKEIDLDIFKNKIVLIGATAPDLHDEQIVPTSDGVPMAGAEIHANLINTVLANSYLSYQSKNSVILTILFIALISSFIFSQFKATRGLIAALILVIIYLILAITIFDFGLIVNLPFPILTIFLVYFINLFAKYFFEEKEKRRLRKIFTQYVSSAVANEILAKKELKLGGDKKKMTVLFSDIRDFTTISEKLKPEELVRLLNEYLTAMTKLIFKERGVVDKYMGDAIMAFWGAPLEEKDHAFLACVCALEMIESLKKLREKNSRIKNLPILNIGIGINTGEMVVGNMGSEKRFSYTVMGDSVNLGSRLEGLNKEYNTNIIISEFTLDELQKTKKADQFIYRFLDKVVVKGKTEPVNIYELKSLIH